jgi:hypothetical protein
MCQRMHDAISLTIGTTVILYQYKALIHTTLIIIERTATMAQSEEAHVKDPHMAVEGARDTRISHSLSLDRKI